MACADHWHCDPAHAPHKCDAPDRTKACPSCGERLPLTADTITDEQIRDLLGQRTYGPCAETRTLVSALGLSAVGTDVIAKARARCAEIINKREGRS